MNIINFRGDLTDNSAKKKALYVISCAVIGRCAMPKENSERRPATATSDFVLKTKQNIMGYFDPKNIILNNEYKQFVRLPNRYFG